MNTIQYFNWGTESDAKLLQKILTELSSKDLSAIERKIKFSAIYDDYGLSGVLQEITQERKAGVIEKIIISFKVLDVIDIGSKMFFQFINVPYFYAHLEKTIWLFEDKDVMRYDKENTRYLPFYVSTYTNNAKQYNENDIVKITIMKR